MQAAAMHTSPIIGKDVRPKTKHIRLPTHADRDYVFALRHSRFHHWEEEECLQSRQPPRELGEQRQA
mgnify:FL=1